MCICDCGPKGEKDKCEVRECRRNTQIFEAWENLRKAAVKSSDWKRKRHLAFLQSAVPLHIRNGSGYDAPMFSIYSVSSDFGERSILFQICSLISVANVRAFKVKSSATLKPLSLATVLIYQHACMNLSAELAWYHRYEASQPVTFHYIRQVVSASHEIRTVRAVCSSWVVIPNLYHIA